MRNKKCPNRHSSVCLICARGANRRLKVRYPWYVSWLKAKERCNDKNHYKYHRYGGRGIQMNLSQKGMTFLWKRDKGGLLKKPTLDRIANDGNYTLSNCRFIEREENSSKGAK